MDRDIRNITEKEICFLETEYTEDDFEYSDDYPPKAEDVMAEMEKEMKEKEYQKYADEAV